MKKDDCFELYNGVRIPVLGYGTYKAAEGKGSEAIELAIEAGYRYFDTASFYDTEGYLGEAIRKSGLPREDFFISSKAWKTEMGYEETKAALQRTLENLGTEYLDLYLIHWPRPELGLREWRELDRETWRAMEELYEEGKVRAIGLSNFLLQHILPLLEHCRIRPMVDQLEFHPGYTQEAALRFCEEQGMLVQAWSPLGRSRVLADDLILELSAKYGVSPARLCLRYALQRNVQPLPKASSLERIRENMDLFSFEITKEDLYRISTMPQTGWSGEHPDRERVLL